MTDLRKMRTQLRKRSVTKTLESMLVIANTDLAYAVRVLELKDGPTTSSHPDFPSPVNITDFEVFKEATVIGGFF